MNDIETLYRKSNSVLFNLNYNKDIRDIVVARTNLARSVFITDTSNNEFDKLLSTLQNSIDNSDDLQVLSIINKVNKVLVSTTDSLTAILNLMSRNLK